MALEDPHAISPYDEPTAPHRDTDAARLGGDERLPCGRLVSHAWERAGVASDQADPHTADCAFCRQAVEGLTALDNATRTLRAERPSAHTVADRVVRAVRAEVRPGRMLPLDDPARELRIAETAVAKVLRRAADRPRPSWCSALRRVLEPYWNKAERSARSLLTAPLIPHRGDVSRRAS
jgi:hypothetical protein